MAWKAYGKSAGLPISCPCGSSHHIVLVQVAVIVRPCRFPLSVEVAQVLFGADGATAHSRHPVKGFLQAGEIFGHVPVIGKVRIHGVPVLEIAALAVVGLVKVHHRFFGNVIVSQGGELLADEVVGLDAGRPCGFRFHAQDIPLALQGHP